jgi:glycosyltransferase involved in cell wall biosynthesis
MPTIAFVVNGGPGSAMGQRARAFADRLPAGFTSTLHHRERTRGAAFATYVRTLRARRPSVIYLLDLTLPAVMASSLMRRMTGCRVVIDIGDATADLIYLHHRVGSVGHRVLTEYENLSLRSADALVVRGAYHREHLAGLGFCVPDLIPDGVDLDLFQPADASALRASLGLAASLTVGVVGSLRWIDRLQWTTGMELIEAIAAVQSARVAGLIIGQGSGLRHLRARAEALGVSNRVRFVDQWFEPARLSAFINCMDVCLSTQTNNLIGRVRTTGKLPLFLASGKFVAATRVGEAARLLPEPMLLDYAGAFDPGYPRRLAERIDHIDREPSLLSLGSQNRDIAAAAFDYRMLATRVARVVETVLDSGRSAA